MTTEMSTLVYFEVNIWLIIMFNDYDREQSYKRGETMQNCRYYREAFDQS